MYSTEERCVLRAAGCVSLGRVSARASAVVLLASALACVPDVVTWDTEREIPAPSSGARLTLGGASALFVPVAGPPLTGGPTQGACAGSIRIARGAGRELHAVWWLPRPDSSASLVASHSMDGGGSWSAIVPVDTSDISGIGCQRLAPAIAVDPATGYIHVVYSLKNVTGSGVFFSHSMEHGALYHAPVPIVFGDAMTSADVAAFASRVVVAYEDPNLREQSAGRVALAISRSDGHIFEHRVPVTGGTAAVGTPRVAIEGDRVAVAWAESARQINGTVQWKARIGTIVARK